LKSENTMEHRHSGEYTADGLCKVIDFVGPEYICAVTTDNASSMKSSWKFIAMQYPKIEFTGCNAHWLNLTVEEICSIPEVAAVLQEAI
jgi:hypothetical protein